MTESRERKMVDTNLSKMTHIPMEVECFVPKTTESTGADDEWKAYGTQLDDYLNAWCKKQQQTPGDLTEIIWSGSNPDFSGASLANFNTDHANLVRSLLVELRVEIKCKRGFSRKKALIEFWMM